MFKRSILFVFTVNQLMNDSPSSPGGKFSFFISETRLINRKIACYSFSIHANIRFNLISNSQIFEWNTRKNWKSRHDWESKSPKWSHPIYNFEIETQNVMGIFGSERQDELRSSISLWCFSNINLKYCIDRRHEKEKLWYVV